MPDAFLGVNTQKFTRASNRHLIRPVYSSSMLVEKLKNILKSNNTPSSKILNNTHINNMTGVRKEQELVKKYKTEYTKGRKSSYQSETK